MLTDRPLRYFEEILLLQLDDDKGTTKADSWYKTEMGGAILAELVMYGAITIADDKKKQVQVRPGADTPQDPIMAEALGLIREAKKPKRASDWVQKFSNFKDLKNRVARQLVAKGVLREDEGKVLGLFKRTIYPETDPGPEQELRRRMEAAIFEDSAEVDPHTTVIIALAQATGLLNRVFPKKRLKPRKERIEAVVNGNLAGKATKEAVEAIQTVVLVCAIMPAVIATTTIAAT